MNKSIQNIFNESKQLLKISDRIIYYFRIQSFYKALKLSSVLFSYLVPLIEKLAANKNYFNEEYEVINIISINQMLESLLKVQEDKDWVLLADLYEVRIVGFLLSLQEKIIFKEELSLDEERLKNTISKISEVNEELGKELNRSMDIHDILNNGYLVEYTSTGDFTIGVERNQRIRYFHSNNRVEEEALTLAGSWHQEGKTEYIIYGLGFAYHIMGLLELDDSLLVEVYESDINIIKLACAFSNLDQLLKNPKFKLIYDPQFNQLANKVQSINEEMEFVIHYPSLLNIKNMTTREKLEDYFINYSCVKSQLKYLNDNFSENIKHEHPSVEVLEEKFKNKDLYILAAGPSLDKNFMQLKNISSNGIILAVGTVFRKLLTAGIKPDYVIITDASPRMRWQIAGLEEAGIPLIYLSTACQAIIKSYKGDKYIIYQEGYEPSESEANQRNAKLFNTGGSVSTTALDIGIGLSCKRIIFLGLDLSYPNNMSHASGTALVKMDDTSDLREVEAVSGGIVYTNKPMDMYRRWIEKRISRLKEPEIINATEGGAFIKGMKYAKLQDVIK